MKTMFGEKLPEGHYMLWRVDPKLDTPKIITTYFMDKYGYEPTEAVVGKYVDLIFPMASVVKGIFVQDYHIKMR